MRNRIGAITAVMCIPVLCLYIGCKMDAIDETASGPDANAVLSVTVEIPDFGLTEAEAEEKSAAVSLSNTSEYTFTINSVSISDDANFSIDPPSLPLTLEPGDTAAAECSFHPVASGTLTGEITAAVEGFLAPASVSVSGEGNYAPTIAPGLMVFDDDPEIAGFYEEDGTKNGKPLYRNCEDTGYFLYFIDSPSKWVIHTSSDVGTYTNAVRYQDQPDKKSYASPDQVEKWNNDCTDVQADVTGPVISGANLSDVTPKVTTVRVYYYFCDNDSDTENGSDFTWYLCPDGSDPGTEIPDTRSTSYTIRAEDEDRYLRVEMTPCSGEGIPDGQLTTGPHSSQLQIGGLPE